MKVFFSSFIPRVGFYITPIIINLNIIIFMMMVIAGLGTFSLNYNLLSFKDGDLLSWGANFKPSIINGEWWRLLTCTFLHTGLMHLFLNMYVLFFVGGFLEPRLVKTKFALFYLVAGALANITILWRPDGTVSAGASAAIFGLYGVILSLLLTKKIFPKDFNKGFLRSTLIYVVICLLLEFAGASNAVHLGGLTSGFILGLVFTRRTKEGYKSKIMIK
jgi:rhomboid protease GluP